MSPLHEYFFPSFSASELQGERAINFVKFPTVNTPFISMGVKSMKINDRVNQRKNGVISDRINQRNDRNNWIFEIFDILKKSTKKKTLINFCH